MSWITEIRRISIVKHKDGEFPFEVELYNREGRKVYHPPRQKTGDDAWRLANHLHRQLTRTGILEMYIVDETLIHN